MAALGEILQHAREQRGISLEEAERVTHIARRYLAALEAEDFSAFPAPVFGRGFLRNYSQFLGLNANDMLALWPAEGVQAAAQHDAISAEPAQRGLRFPWRGRATPDEPDIDEPLPEDTRPHLPRRAPLDDADVRLPEPPRRQRQAWQPLRDERRATLRRTLDAPSPLTVGQKPERGTAPRGVVALLFWLVPLVALLVFAFAVSRSKGSSSALVGNTSAPASVNAGANTPARSAGAMPKLVGANGQAAIQQLRALGVEPLVITVSDGAATPGTVTKQQPSAGAAISTTSSVTLIVEAGGATVPSPSVVVPSVRPSAAATVRATPGTR